MSDSSVFARVRGALVTLGLTALSAACSAPAPATPSPVVSWSPETPVTVSGGQVQGALTEANPEIVTFKGIPYAAPPIGDLRWKPPQPVVAWDGVRDATTNAPICLQAGPAAMGAQAGPQSEDCLVLNVWAPRETATLLPVMVWVHGGGFFNGSISYPTYDGTRFAEQGVVLVSLNYRLNVFGFFAHPALSAESPHGASGNYGLMDVVAGLDWVRDNIASFGGDPERVTLFGESAGGGAVMSAMLMPQAEGLFHRAIAESTWVYGWDRPLKEAMGGWDSAEAQGVAIAEALGGSDDDALETIRAASADEVLAVANAGTGNLLMRTGYLWAPNVDGWTIPDDPVRMYDEGRQHDVPLLTGMNADEGASPARQLNVQTPGDLEAHVRAVYPDVADEALAHYDLGSDESARAESAHLVTDMYFAGPVRLQTDSHTRLSSPVWLYHFTRVPPTDFGALAGSYHGAEVVYVFGTMMPGSPPEGATPNPLAPYGAWTDADRQLSDTMMAYWTQFAATGDPNRDGLLAWPAHEPSTDQHLTLGDTVALGESLHHSGGALFRSFDESRRALR